MVSGHATQGCSGHGGRHAGEPFEGGIGRRIRTNGLTAYVGTDHDRHQDDQRTSCQPPRYTTP